jgi:hypothetical protein
MPLSERTGAGRLELACYFKRCLPAANRYREFQLIWHSDAFAGWRLCWRYGIARSEGHARPARQQPPKSQSQAAEDAILPNGLKRILRASRLVGAANDLPNNGTPVRLILANHGDIPGSDHLPFGRSSCVDGGQHEGEAHYRQVRFRPPRRA